MVVEEWVPVAGTLNLRGDGEDYYRWDQHCKSNECSTELLFLFQQAFLTPYPVTITHTVRFEGYLVSGQCKR